MTRVICTRENASELINGVKFAPHKDDNGVQVGMISEKITAEQAESFLEVGGYEIVAEAAPAPVAKPAAAPAAPKGPTKAEKEAAAKESAEKESAAKAAAEKKAAETKADEAKSDATPPVEKPAADEETF